MNTIFAVLLLVGGLVILWKSAELLVSGAVGLAQRLGISSLVIGLTVVAMGTSAPEVAASIAGVLQKANGGDLALGNVFGSNITNLALVGGLIALIRPLVVKKLTLQREVPVMLAVALLLWPFLHNSSLARTEAAALLIVFVALILLISYVARKEAQQAKLITSSLEAAKKYDMKSIQKSVIFVVIGLIGLAVGAKMTVVGAVFVFKERLGLSDSVIGLTVIAFGTSLPELVTCVVAAVKGEHDISVGNLVGSNIFNTLLVTGAAGLVKPFDVSPRLAGGIDYWIMITVSAVFAALIIVGRRVVGRIAGVILLCGYFAYIVYLFAFGPANI
ncbi:MAG: calcium/sodium antiporter [Sedimentisphaerales bacterium]|nr:calcium/sodium antiporter [Sedimentisphaerales bacterium]